MALARKKYSQVEYDIGLISKSIEEMKNTFLQHIKEDKETSNQVDEIEEKINRFDNYLKIRNEVKNWLIVVLFGATCSLSTYVFLK